MQMLETGFSFIATIVAAGIGGYIGSYLKKKGENTAAKKDIQEITGLTKVLSMN